MKEHPILFSTDMVKAILEGRKTQTRRPLKPQPEQTYFNGDWYADQYNHTADWCFWGRVGTDVTHKCGLPLFRCPYGQVGDRLWVKEAHEIYGFHADFNTETCTAEICYTADNLVVPKVPVPWEEHWKWLKPDKVKTLGIRRPSIFMPRWASRITLEITDIRVQRVQEISEEDAIAEETQKIATRWAPIIGLGTPEAHIGEYQDETYKHAFSGLWDSINAKRGYSWAANPWVWAITFKRLENV